MSKDNITFREKWAARWRGFTDAWRDVPIDPQEKYIKRNLDYLIARQNMLMRQYVMTLVKETQGCVVPMERLRSAVAPQQSTALGQAGRDWHNYEKIRTAGRAAADQVIGRHKTCQVGVDEARASAQAIIDRYVAVVKRFHPLRTALSDWTLEVPILSEQNRVIEQRFQLAQEILERTSQFTDRGI